MKKPGFGDIFYFVFGVWIISFGLKTVFGVIKGLRK